MFRSIGAVGTGRPDVNVGKGGCSRAAGGISHLTSTWWRWRDKGVRCFLGNDLRIEMLTAVPY